jgi:hypothetical protein
MFIVCFVLTCEFIQGRNIPIEKTPKSGPFVIASKLIVNCNTVPAFSTTYTMQTDEIPITTTVDLMTQLIIRSVNGFFANGFTKSSKTTADIEFRHVDKELRAAEKTPEMKRPLNPGNSPNVSITNNGNI